MNKGIIVVLVLLLLAGLVIAGIVLTRKSKYTKGTNAPVPLLAPNDCQTNCHASYCTGNSACCNGNACETDDSPTHIGAPCPCAQYGKGTNLTCQTGDDGKQGCYFDPIVPGGPPGKGCVCNGRGRCSDGQSCTCDTESGLNDKLGCQVCKRPKTWHSEVQKCVSPTNPCEPGGTPGPDGKLPCKCFAGWTEKLCDRGEARWLDLKKTGGCASSLQAKDGTKGCQTLGVCPWGEGVQLEFDTSYHSGGCLSPGMAAKSAYTQFGCYIIPTITDGPAGLQGGPNCKFISYFNPTLVEKGNSCEKDADCPGQSKCTQSGFCGFDRNSPDRVPLEEVTVTQGDCDAGWKAGHVTAFGTRSGYNIPTCEGSFKNKYSGQVSIGPPLSPVSAPPPH